MFAHKVERSRFESGKVAEVRIDEVARCLRCLPFNRDCWGRLAADGEGRTSDWLPLFLKDSEDFFCTGGDLSFACRDFEVDDRSRLVLGVGEGWRASR